jgi:alkylhydroperoxidase family enzyme
MQLDIDARQDSILGKPPRILPLTGNDAVEAVEENTHRLRQGVLGKSVPDLKLSEIPEIVPTLLRHPDLWNRICDLSIQLLGCSLLKPRDRQLAILRILWLWQAPYAWDEHVRHSKKAGLTSEEIERVTIGAQAPGWDEHERALLAAAEELHDSAMISDATWDVLAKRLDENQLFELTVAIGQFTTVAYLQNALRLRLEPGSAGLRAR